MVRLGTPRKLQKLCLVTSSTFLQLIAPHSHRASTDGHDPEGVNIQHPDKRSIELEVCSDILRTIRPHPITVIPRALIPIEAFPSLFPRGTGPRKWLILFSRTRLGATFPCALMAYDLATVYTTRLRTSPRVRYTFASLG